MTDKKRSDEERKEELAKIIFIVDKLLNDLARYYDVLGFDGIVDLVNPTLKELLDAINSFEEKANKFLHDATTEVIKEDYFEINDIINLKQGLLFARGLIISAMEKDIENCEFYRNNLGD